MNNKLGALTLAQIFREKTTKESNTLRFQLRYKRSWKIVGCPLFLSSIHPSFPHSCAYSTNSYYALYVPQARGNGR